MRSPTTLLARALRLGALMAAFAIGLTVALLARGDSGEPVDDRIAAAPATTDVTARELVEPVESRTTGVSDEAPPEAMAFEDEFEPASGSAFAEEPPTTPSTSESDNVSSSAQPSAPVPGSTESSAAANDDGESSPGRPASTTTTGVPPTSRAPISTTTTVATRAPAPTTTTTMPAPVARGDGEGIEAITARSFTDWPIRNTNLDSRTQFVSTPAAQLDWRQFTEASDRTIGLGSVTANKHLGQFRTQCSFSHFAYDDPLVNPGDPGAAHLHMFFGNTQANAHSTYRSLRDSGSSSCNGFEGNRTAYWVPAVFDASANVRIPSRIEVYYKSHDRAFSIVEQPPAGLGMVAGQAATNPNISWACQETGAQGTNLNRPVQQVQNTIPRCSNTATLLAHIKFPQCVSGNVSERSQDNTSQMQYPTRGYFTNSCPAGSRYMTAIEYFIAWNPNNHDGQTDQWWLASDVRPDGTRAPNGSTLHGDWFGAWNPELMDRIHETCVSQLAECGWDLTANNERLQWVEHFGARDPAAYSGRRAIPAAEIAGALCPDQHHTRPEDAAVCGGGHH